MTLASRPFPIFCATLCLSIEQPVLWRMCSTLLIEMSAKSPGFHKWWPRCLSLNTASASQSQRRCEAVSDACLHPTHPGLSYSPSLNMRPFKWQRPVSNPVIILSWFLLKLSNSPDLLRKPLACLCPRKDLNTRVSCFSSPWSLPWQPLQICQGQAQVLSVDVRSLVWLIDQLFHFYQSPRVLLCSASFIRDGRPRLIYNLSAKCQPP